VRPLRSFFARGTPGTPGTLGDFVFAFVAIFAGLALPSPGLGPLHSRAYAALGEWLVGGTRFASGVRLLVDATPASLTAHPFQATLHVLPSDATGAVTVPIDLRTLAYLPTAAFIALALSTPTGSWKKNARLLAVGLTLLVPLLFLLIVTPILSFLGGTGPIQAFALGRATHVVLQLVYRALVVPPGMAYAIPLLVWWGLVVVLEGNSVAGKRAASHAESPSDPEAPKVVS
jgi:hypothetical protein